MGFPRTIWIWRGNHISGVIFRDKRPASFLRSENLHCTRQPDKDNKKIESSKEEGEVHIEDLGHPFSPRIPCVCVSQVTKTEATGSKLRQSVSWGCLIYTKSSVKIQMPVVIILQRIEVVWMLSSYFHNWFKYRNRFFSIGLETGCLQMYNWLLLWRFQE